MTKVGISVKLMEQWLKAWSLSRKLPAPARFKSGFRVDVGYDNQRARYVFPELNDDFLQLAETIKEPWIYLKVCAPREAVINVISNEWEVEPQRYMMTSGDPMKSRDTVLNQAYKLEYETTDASFIVRIHTGNGDLAAIGHLVIIENLAVYDRISTEPAHRRKGLGSFVMKELERIAVSNGIFNNFLAATEEGKRLYESLGWKVHCLYTSAVIRSL
ncbi:MAG: family N-acetyltransferase [Ferruginibacter sp.]|nr:family N-acetyltransferase [Ferruginibacter sp.]